MAEAKERVTEIVPEEADTRDDFIILSFRDKNGNLYETRLNSMHATNLLFAVRGKLEELVAQPAALRGFGIPGMHHVQFYETPETEFFRIFLSAGLYHEYPVPRNTTLGQILKEMADKVEAQNEAKATHLQSGSPDRTN